MERRGSIEQVNHYYPYGGLMGVMRGQRSWGQVFE